MYKTILEKKKQDDNKMDFDFALSKNLFLKYLQCPLFFYYSFSNPELSSPQDKSKWQISRFNQEQTLQSLQEKFSPIHLPQQKELDSKENILQAFEQTQKLMQTQKTIHKAVIYANNNYSVVDFLQKQQDGWLGYTIKTSGGINHTHILESAYTLFLLQENKINIKDFFIVGINSHYNRKDSLELEKLFWQESVLQQCLDKKNQIQESIEQAHQLVQKKILPTVAIGEHCFQPYHCSFHHLCWKQVPQNSVFNLKAISNEQKMQIHKKYPTIDKLNKQNIKEFSFLQKRHLRQIEGQKTQKVYLDKKKLCEFFSQWEFPLFFVDFEAFMTPVPLYENTHPYQAIPFQFSVHKLDQDFHLEHKEFLSNAGIDPREDFIKNLIDACEQKGSLVAFNMGFEKRTIQKLQNEKKFSSYRVALENLQMRFIDLAIPFESCFFYHPQMQGSFSLKKILPALTSLNYDHLQIRDGGQAMLQFLLLAQEQDAKTIEQTRKHLLEYCALDSLAMVKIYFALIGYCQK